MHIRSKSGTNRFLSARLCLTLILIFIFTPLQAYSQHTPEAQLKREKRVKRALQDAKHSLLALDLDGDGIDLTSVMSARAVYWDIDQDGFAEATGWIGPKDALLAVDRNENGEIDSHAELFGGELIDGFSLLAAFDENKDGVISPDDKGWSDLLIWRDENTDGRSQKHELYPLEKSNITSIDLKAEKNHVVIHNEHRITAEGEFYALYAGIDGVKPKANRIVNTFPAFSETNVYFKGDYNADIRAYYLPNLRGYGNLPDLFIAMSKDNKGEKSLLFRVAKLHNASFEELFHPDRDLEAEIEAIMFRWAKVEDLDPGGRGPHIDARRLAFLERFLDSEFVQKGANNVPDPLFWAAVDLKEGYRMAFNEIFARLIMQSAGRELVKEDLEYLPRKDSFYFKGLEKELKLSLSPYAFKRFSLQAGSTSDWNKRDKMWKDFVRALAYSVKLESLRDEDKKLIDTKLKAVFDGGGLNKMYHEVDKYRDERVYNDYAVADHLYKHLGIRFYSSLVLYLTVFGFVTGSIAIYLFPAFFKRFKASKA